jgi:hypothetical protein
VFLCKREGEFRDDGRTHTSCLRRNLGQRFSITKGCGTTQCPRRRCRRRQHGGDGGGVCQLEAVERVKWGQRRRVLGGGFCAVHALEAVVVPAVSLLDEAAAASLAWAARFGKGWAGPNY